MTHVDEHATVGPFELSGGALCLDFANTWGNQSDPASDRLRDYASLLAFARQTGQLTAPVGAGLARAASTAPDEAARVVALAKKLRQVIYRCFSRRASCEEVAATDVGHINSILGEALSRRRLQQTNGGLVWTWTEGDTGDLRTPIWPIVESAATLLTSDRIDRVRECQADDCNWLFLDSSRGGTRRWCSMQSCGNRAKARRHYHRRKEG